ncbi:hypothetical protein R7127_20600 [Vibrio sp. 1159]|uniref:hypothetical protein n=1 Tax=Vibrio sp. 1159 TaxID=3074545 RepID=UPI0029646090|nr:hypothetical protein [Vibrio sp. 1159]MDW2322671.1 hypothetical protein [Vibrio sp. 1159]
MKFEWMKELNEFILSVNDFLHNEENHNLVQYPSTALNTWDTDSISIENDSLLNSISGTANIYAIFECKKESGETTLKYIGKTSRHLARQRLRNHLIKKHSATGAKLKEVQKSVREGNLIKVAYLPIEPESLRNYVEEELIILNKNAVWNRENANQK